MYYGLANARQIKELAQRVCDVLGHGSNNNAVDLLVETCAAETLLGTARDRTLYNAGAGVAQVDYGTFDWLKNKYKDRSIAAKLKKQLNIDLARVKYNELDNSPLLSLIFCRLRYWTVAAAIPQTKAGRALYWKTHYNSSAGKGTPEEYLQRCKAVLSLIDDETIVTTAIIIADMTAIVLNDDDLRFDALSDADRAEVISRVADYAEHSDLINSPAELQAVNANALRAAGWAAGEFSLAGKQSPFLGDFADLPGEIQVFIKSMYAVLSSMVFS